MNVGYSRHTEGFAHFAQDLQRLFIANPCERIQARTVCLPVRPFEYIRNLQPGSYFRNLLGDTERHVFSFDHTRTRQEEEVIRVCQFVKRKHDY